MCDREKMRETESYRELDRGCWWREICREADIEGEGGRKTRS